MSTREETRGRASEDDRRRARYDEHRAERRAIGARARAEARLQAAFERDALSLAELESRLVAVNKATTSAEIDTALVDVPELDEVDAPAPTALATAPTSGWAVAVLGGTKRSGRWRVPRRLRAVAALGGCELDFRQAELGPETDVHCVAVMGGIEIKVPPSVRVEGGGVGILGGFEHGHAGSTHPDAPVLRIHGLALMGGVEIKTAE